MPAEPLTKLRRKPLQLRVELAKKADSVIFSKPLELQVQTDEKSGYFLRQNRRKENPLDLVVTIFLKVSFLRQK